MALFVIGDTHLSLGAEKPMDIFPGWENYLERLEKQWRCLVSQEDTVVIPGDVSWSMSLEGCGADFGFLQQLPGQKILLKGNHDYWWSTKTKMDKYLQEQGFDSLHILFNNSFPYENVALCGTRGWIYEPGEAHDQKIVAREAGRLRLSLEDAQRRYPEKEKLVFLHYPPLYCGERNEGILQVLRDYKIKRVWYGHIHSAGCRFALNGESEGIQYRLISADFLRFTPQTIRL